MNSFEEELETYNAYWRKKLSANIKRDQFVTKFLNDHGWMVLRYWESSIKSDTLAIAEEIYGIVSQRKPKIWFSPHTHRLPQDLSRYGHSERRLDEKLFFGNTEILEALLKSAYF